MKSTIRFSLFLTILSYSFLWADSISLGSVKVTPGDTATVGLILENSLEVRGFQFTVTPSPLVDVSFLEAKVRGRTSGWTVGSNSESGKIIILGFSSTGSSMITGNDTILTFKFLIAKNAVERTIALDLSNVSVSDTNLIQITGITVTNGAIIISTSNPKAVFTCSSQSGQAPFVVNFNASGSSAPSGTITIYSWDFGDGNTSTEGPIVNHTYNISGTYNVKLTVTDGEGRTGTITKSVFVYQAGAYQRGDVNRDGKTDIFDLLELLLILCGTKPN